MQHHPLPEYPRPALRRDSYENLNGLWQYAITGSAGLPAKWDGDILVPYSPEANASGEPSCVVRSSERGYLTQPNRCSAWQ